MDTHALTSLLERLARHPGQAIDEDERALLEESARLYPYLAPALTELAVRAPAGTPEAETLRLAAAIRGASHPEFDNTVENGEWTGFYPEGTPAPQPDTEEAIDTFLSTFGHTSPEEEALLNRLIFNPVPDYAEMLAREEQENLPEKPGDDNDDSAEARINAFILEKHPAAREAALSDTPEEIPAPPDDSPVAPPEPHDDSLLSESLAKIYIKQGRYERAYEIISGLNLKFPKKSVYFADQLRFLQKLIINQRAKARN